MTYLRSKGYFYDANGNVRYHTGQSDVVSYQYDSWLNKVTYRDETTHDGFSKTNYAYNASNERMWKQVQQSDNFLHITKTLYLHGDNPWPLVEKETYQKQNLAGTVTYQTQSTVKWHIYGKNGLIATHTNGETIEFMLKDHLGSPRVVLQQTITQGGVSGLSQSGSYAWHPFGGMLESYGDAEPDYGFTGQEKDHESGLHNFRARAYHEQLGRFFAVDPQGQYHSPYVYGGNNPLMIVDPDGKWGFFAYPTISWSKKGGFSLGFTAGIGVPGLWSAQVGSSYNFKEKDWSASLSGSYMLASSYASYSGKGGWSTGVSYGASQYSGLPFSTNALNAGVNYSFKSGYWNGSLSAWQVDKNGWSFNLSASAALFPESFSNFVNGNGFKANELIPVTNEQNEYSRDASDLSYNKMDDKGILEPTLNEKVKFVDGFFARLEKIGNKYYLAFRGTNDLADVGQNILNALGIRTSQYEQAIKLASAVAKEVGAKNLIVTGHSLGGGLAHAAAIANNLKAITFNAASPAPVYRYNGQVAGFRNNIIFGDPLSMINASTLQLPIWNMHMYYRIPWTTNSFLHGIKGF